MSFKNVMIISDEKILPGERKIIKVPVANLYDQTPLNIPVEVIRGKKKGPIFFVSAGIHGDEINGIEIIRRLLLLKSLNNLKGTLIAIPIVNVFGFINKSRYLPDRRDLNRSFPGSPNGTLASRMANIFMNEIVNKCDYGIDIHTAAQNRTNLPQIRADLMNSRTKKLAVKFGTPVILNSKLRDGSLREAASNKKIPMLLFEGGEALRFNSPVIKMGLQGILSVLKEVGMLPKSNIDKIKSFKKKTYMADYSFWIRAPKSGILKINKELGNYVKKNELIGKISDPLGTTEVKIYSKSEGVIIGKTQMPLVHQGDPIFHLATFEESEEILQEMANGEIFDLYNN